MTRKKTVRKKSPRKKTPSKKYLPKNGASRTGSLRYTKTLKIPYFRLRPNSDGDRANIDVARVATNAVRVGWNGCYSLPTEPPFYGSNIELTLDQAKALGQALIDHAEKEDATF